jgi:hypothetical protein
MSLRNFWGNITENYAWELNLFYKINDFKDSFHFCEFELKFDRFPADHNPQFNFSLEILNIVIFDFTIYNVYHEDDPHSPFYDEIHDTYRH